jgi:hypothetical protein
MLDQPFIDEVSATNLQKKNMDHHREIQLRADRGEKFRFFCVIVYQGILFFKGRPCLLYIQTPLNRQMKCSSSFYSIADDGWWTTGSWNNSSNKKNGGPF